MMLYVTNEIYASLIDIGYAYSGIKETIDGVVKVRNRLKRRLKKPNLDEDVVAEYEDAVHDLNIDLKIMREQLKDLKAFLHDLSKRYEKGTGSKPKFKGNQLEGVPYIEKG